MKDFKETLIELQACEEAMIWIGDKDFKTFYETCERGDWLLWLYARTNKDDLKGLTLAKAHCANTVRYLMKDKRSTESIDVAILFGEGKATLGQLNVASLAAYYASSASAYDAYASASLAAYYASFANASAYATAESAANAATYAAKAYAAKKQNQQLTADICRKYLPIENFNINYLTNMKNLNKTINNLKLYQKWRMGRTSIMPSACLITNTINDTIEFLDELKKLKTKTVKIK